MGSEAGDQTRPALAKAMATALGAQVAPRTQAILSYETTTLAPRTTTITTSGDASPVENRRWPLPVSRILQRGSLAPAIDVKSDEMRDASLAIEGDDDDEYSGEGAATMGERSGCSSPQQDATIELAMTLLRKLQQDAGDSSDAVAPALSTTAQTVAVTKEQVDQILAGFAKALESSASSEERGVRSCARFGCTRVGNQ